MKSKLSLVIVFAIVATLSSCGSKSTASDSTKVDTVKTVVTAPDTAKTATDTTAVAK